MTLGSRRTQLIVIAGIALAVVAFFLLRGGDAPRSGPDGVGSAGTAADRAEAPGRAGPRRNVDDDKFGAEFRGGGGPVMVRGQVVEVGGAKGVANVDVVFSAPSGEETVTSGADGTFSIQLTPGAYQVRAIAETAYAPSRPLQVGRVTDALHLTIEVTALARIVGWVVDAAGVPVAGAKVSLGRPRGTSREQAKALSKDGVAGTSVDTTGDGRFEIGALPGEILLMADHPRSGHGVVELKAVPAGSLEEDVEIRLQPYGSLLGVTVGPDSKPRPGVQVLIAVRTPGTNARQYLEQASDSQGRFEIPGLMPGRAVVEAKAEGFAASAPMNVEIVAGQRTPEVVLALQQPQQLVGRVLDGTGAPVYLAKVKVERHGSGSSIGVVKTEGDGTFQFPTLDGGPYTLTVTAPGFPPARRELPTLPTQPIEIALLDPGTIRGVVTGADGKPVRQFTVVVEKFVPSSGGATGTLPAPAQFASDEGRFEQTGVEPGTYDLVVRADGATEARRAGVVVAPGETADASIQLGKP